MPEWSCEISRCERKISCMSERSLDITQSTFPFCSFYVQSRCSKGPPCSAQHSSARRRVWRAIRRRWFCERSLPQRPSTDSGSGAYDERLHLELGTRSWNRGTSSRGCTAATDVEPYKHGFPLSRSPARLNISGRRTAPTWRASISASGPKLKMKSFVVSTRPWVSWKTSCRGLKKWQLGCPGGGQIVHDQWHSMGQKSRFGETFNIVFIIWWNFISIHFAVSSCFPNFSMATTDRFGAANSNFGPVKNWSVGLQFLWLIFNRRFLHQIFKLLRLNKI